MRSSRSGTFVRFDDALVAAKDLDVTAPDKQPSKREVDMAGNLVDALAGKWQPAKLKDTYRERVLELIEAKAKGKQLVAKKADEPAEESDLMAALQASIKGAKR